MRRLRIQKSEFRQVAEEEYDVDLAVRVITIVSIVLSCVVTSPWLCQSTKWIEMGVDQMVS